MSCGELIVRAGLGAFLSAVYQRVLIVSTVPSPPGLVVRFEAFFFGPLSAFGLRASRFERFWPLAIFTSNRGEMPRRCPTPVPRRKPDNSYQAKYPPAFIAGSSVASAANVLVAT